MSHGQIPRTTLLQDAPTGSQAGAQEHAEVIRGAPARRLLVADVSLGVLCALTAFDRSAAQGTSSANQDGKAAEAVTEVVVTARRKPLQ
jgi:hypothetical protein